MFLGYPSDYFKGPFNAYTKLTRVSIKESDLDYISDLFSCYELGLNTSHSEIYDKLSELTSKDRSKFQSLIMVITIELICMRKNPSLKRALFLLHALGLCGVVCSEKSVPVKWNALFKMFSRVIGDISHNESNRAFLSFELLKYADDLGIEEPYNCFKYDDFDIDESTDTVRASNSLLFMYCAVLIKHFEGFDINRLRNTDSETPLMLFAKSNLTRDLHLFLIRMGADPNIENKAGHTPLHYVSFACDGYGHFIYEAFFPHLIGISVESYKRDITEEVQLTGNSYEIVNSETGKPDIKTVFDVNYTSYYGGMLEYIEQHKKLGIHLGIPEKHIDYFHAKAKQELAFSSVTSESSNLSSRNQNRAL